MRLWPARLEGVRVTTEVTRVLVTGGAGYIGSHVVKELRRAGF
ncbi:NAD-dependent epimerase/dehydratase family protein, partial [Geminicoccus flavidas]